MRVSKGGPRAGLERSRGSDAAGSKRSRATVPGVGARAVAIAVLAGALSAAVLAGCAADPVSAVEERTDERTAVTVATLSKPLLFTGARAETGAALDLALAPFELNRQGRKTWYVWASLLGEDLSRGEPRLRLVAGREVLLDLAPQPATFVPPLSRAPYDKPAGWATERYYAVTAEDLARLNGHGAFDAELVPGEGRAWRFSPWDAAFDALSAYLSEQLQGRVATR